MTAADGMAMHDPAGGAPAIRVFGGIGVHDDDGPVSIGGPRQRRLLALLTIRVGTVVDIDWLAEHLWDDDDRPDETARAIRTYLSRLRQALPPAAQAWIETVPGGYRLDAPENAVEHRRFAALRAAAAEARDAEDPLTAHTLLTEAIELWRGEPFRELDDLPWARAEMEQVRLDRLEVQEGRWEAALALGRHTQIIGELAAFTAEHGDRDRAARQHALALHRSGRSAEALRVLADFRRRLAAESGLDPSPEMVELERALFADDPSLRVESLGRPLRGYRLLEETGAGAFSVVWRGEQPSVRRAVAIKQIRAELASQPDFIRRFEAEAHLVARLEHPHIVPLIDYWRDPDSAYLVMRWLAGGTLERRLDDGPLDLAETLTLARQIGGALTTAHDAGIVHRDVKTANILFDEQGNAFLGDFGIALEATVSAGPEAALSPGSPLYAAPEQLRREPLGPRADVFSLGVVLFECLAGRLPFPTAGSADEVLERQLDVAYPALADLDVEVPAAVSAAVARATEKDADRRFASVAELVAALDGGATASAPARQERSTSELANPYVGLRAFDDGDTDRFFGRDRLRDEIVGRFAGAGVAARCVVVVGPSGSGKSSVARAAVLPALRDGAAPGSSAWFATTMIPGADPYEALEAALLRIAVNPPSSLLDQLRDGPRGVLRGIRRCLPSDADHLLLFIDQFEELFVAAGAHADDFLDALAVAIDDPASPLRLLATLRADYYDRPLGHVTFAPILSAGAVDVTPLAADELERAIVEPATAAGVDFEAGLVARLAAEAVAQPAPLPLLQYALSELFDRRTGSTRLTLAAHDEIGGLSGALAARSEALFLAAGPEERVAIRRVFGRLVDPGAGSADLRRRVPLADLGDDPTTVGVIEAFAAARLLTLDRDPVSREPTVEVAHEALLREWPRLVSWLAEDRDVLRRVDAIARAATEWDDGGRSEADLYRGERLAGAVEASSDDRTRLRDVDADFLAASEAAASDRARSEERRVRRLRRLVAGTAIALTLALVAGGLAVRAQARANDQAEAAELATLISRSASFQNEDRTLSLLLGLEAHRRSPGSVTELAVLDALARETGTSVTPLPPLDAAAVQPCAFAIPSEDGSRMTVIDGGELRLIDPVTGDSVSVGPAPNLGPDGCGAWITDEELTQRVVAGPGDELFVGSIDGADELVIDIGSPYVTFGRRVAGDRVVVLAFEREAVEVYDTLTGQVIAQVTELGAQGAVALSTDGSLVAVTRTTTDGRGELVLIDGVTGSERHRVEIGRPSEEVRIDEVTGEVLVPTATGELVTVDAATGQIVATVLTGATSTIEAVGARPDGLVVLLSAGQAELIDRRLGPTGDGVAVDDPWTARVRSDGSVLQIGSDATVELVEFGRSDFVQQRWNVADDALVNMESGVAAAVGPRGDVELTDLATGARRVPDLLDERGERVEFIAAVPGPEGLRTFTLERGVVARWTPEGELIDQIVTAGEDGRAIGGAFEERRGVQVVERSDGGLELVLVALEDDLSVLQRRPVEEFGAFLPGPDDGILHADDGGTLRTYDASGSLVAEIETTIIDPVTISRARTSNRLAVVNQDGGVVVDPEMGVVADFPVNGGLAGLSFVNDDELLAISQTDGTISLWDIVEEEESILVDGSGSNGQGLPFYDESADVLWLVAQGDILALPMNPDRWIELACAAAGRDLTVDEWERFVPGGGPVRSACA